MEACSVLERIFKKHKISKLLIPERKQQINISSIEGVDIRFGLNHRIFGINNFEYFFVI